MTCTLGIAVGYVPMTPVHRAGAWWLGDLPRA